MQFYCSPKLFVKMLKQVLIAFPLLVTAIFGIPLIEERIFGGAEAVPGQFPHQISLQVFFDPIHHRHICGGSIISERFILTAAHCHIKSYPNISDYRVVVGAHAKNGDDGEAFEVVRFIEHENYNGTSIQHDIALVEVKTEIKFNKRVAPIPLHRAFVGGDVQAITSGWGRTNDTITNLKFAFLYTMTNDECRKRVEGQPDADEIHDFSTLCVYSGIYGTGVCSGDSGGPLVYNNELIGVTSWAFLCARGLPDGFTRVSEYIDWIEKNMKPK